MLTLEIPNNDHLIMAFGDGSESCNLEAIAKWIRSLEQEVDLNDAERRLRALSRVAKQQLEGAVE